MSENSSSNSVGSIAGLANMLTVAFVILKLCGVISWSWWLVALPTLITLGIGILFVIFFIIIAVIGIKKYW